MEHGGRGSDGLDGGRRMAALAARRLEIGVRADNAYAQKPDGGVAWQRWSGFDAESERGAWQKEPGRIRAFYEVQAKRVEPVGLVYLWPETN